MEGPRRWDHTWSPPPPQPPDRRMLLVTIAAVVLALLVAGVLVQSRRGAPVATPVPGASPEPGAPSGAGATPTPSAGASSPGSTASSAPSPANSAEPSGPGGSDAPPGAIPTEYPTPASLPLPTDGPTPQSSGTPGADAPTGDQERPLVANALYDQKLRSSRCARAPGPTPSGEDDYRDFIEATIGCLQRAYAPALKAAKLKSSDPYVVFYTGRVATPCGTAPADLAVFYCSSNETVYATTAALDEYATMRLGLFYVILHEYAHHIQARAGILDAARFRHEDWPQVSRRIELQAECMMGITLHTLSSVRFTAADDAQLRAWRSRVADVNHGSSAAQLSWINRGLRTTELGRCNTWRAPVADVR